MRKVMFLVLAVMLVLGAGVISAQDDGITIGLSLSTLNNPFFVTLRDGAQAAADELGVELIVVDAQDDPATEDGEYSGLDCSKGVDAILINPTDADAIVPSIEAANAANIPVFTVDRGAAAGEVVSHIASDNVAGGAMAARFLCNDDWAARATWSNWKASPERRRRAIAGRASTII